MTDQKINFRRQKIIDYAKKSFDTLRYPVVKMTNAELMSYNDTLNSLLDMDIDSLKRHIIDLLQPHPKNPQPDYLKYNKSCKEFTIINDKFTEIYDYIIDCDDKDNFDLMRLSLFTHLGGDTTLDNFLNKIKKYDCDGFNLWFDEKYKHMMQFFKCMSPVHSLFDYPIGN